MYRCSETNIDQKLPFKTSAPTIIRNCLQRVFWNHWRIKFHHKKIRVVKNCLSHAGKPQWNQISLYQISCIDETKSFVRAFFTKISLELHFDPCVEKFFEYLKYWTYFDSIIPYTGFHAFLQKRTHFSFINALEANVYGSIK